MQESPLYFTRTRGLFRECYPGEKSENPEKTNSPLGERVQLYMSPVETWCRNLDYYIPDEKDVTKTLGKEEMTRIRKFSHRIFIVNLWREKVFRQTASLMERHWTLLIRRLETRKQLLDHDLELCFRHESCNGGPLHRWILLHVRFIHCRYPWMLENFTVEHHSLSHPDAYSL